MPTHKIGNLLTAPGELKTLSGKAQWLLRLQQEFLDAAPPALAQATRVKNFREGTLFILADNAAVAAKLRQLAPRLLVIIRKNQPQITGIQVAVQVRKSQNEVRTKSKKETLSIDSIDKFRRLSEAVPDSPLKSAIAKLVRRHSRPD
jgi:hypothetical protein